MALHRGHREDPEGFERLLSCLDESNRPWAKSAPVLALACTALMFARNGQPNTTAEHDLGAASTYLSLEATDRGLSVHQMAGMLPDRAREVYQIPDGFRPLTGLAIGYVGNPNTLPERYNAPGRFLVNVRRPRTAKEPRKDPPNEAHPP